MFERRKFLRDIESRLKRDRALLKAYQSGFLGYAEGHPRDAPSEYSQLGDPVWVDRWYAGWDAADGEYGDANSRG